MRCLLFFTGLLLFINSSAQQKKLEISHLTGDFYVYTTYHILDKDPYPSNSMYIVTDAGVVLFDTPWDTTQFQPLLDSIEKRHHKKAVLCIATHYHDDRTCGLDFFKQKGIKTYSTKQTLELCKANDNKQAEFYFISDTTFRIGNHSFETWYPGKGHTSDNIVIWFDKEKILYGGCLIKSTETNSLGNTADANLQEWVNSMRRLIKKYPAPVYVIPGHLDWHNKKSPQHTLDLLLANARH